MNELTTTPRFNEEGIEKMMFLISSKYIDDQDTEMVIMPPMMAKKLGDFFS